MPIYEYACEKCGDKIEVIQKFSDNPLKTHEGCGGPLTKLISQSSFHLKGSGWYLTDYARKSSGTDSAGEKEKKESLAKGKDSSESKPDTGKAGTEAKSGNSDGSTKSGGA